MYKYTITYDSVYKNVFKSKRKIEIIAIGFSGAVKSFNNKMKAYNASDWDIRSVTRIKPHNQEG